VTLETCNSEHFIASETRILEDIGGRRMDATTARGTERRQHAVTENLKGKLNMKGEQAMHSEATVRPGRDKHMGMVLRDLLRTFDEANGTRSVAAALAADLDERIAEREAAAERGAEEERHAEECARQQLPEAVTALLEGRYLPLRTGTFLSRIGRALRVPTASFRALAQQCAFDMVAARADFVWACDAFGL
jgi:hypothetical protein